jgi:hypothetical protein
VLLIAGAANCSPPATGPATAAAECVERLVAPHYPPIAASARIGLDNLAVRVRLSQDGSVASFDPELPKGSEEKGKLFQASLDLAIKSSTFRPNCQGRDIQLVYDFQLAFTEKRNEGRVSFHPPNRIEIVSTLPVVQ